jgi:hypothetical protein
VTLPADAPPRRRSRWRRFSPSMGWRAFWSEIVIVVIGVALALGANEAAQDWSWRNKVDEAERRLKDDLRLAFLWSAEHNATQPCVDAQLAALAEGVMRSGDTLAPATVHVMNGHRFVVRMPRRPYRFPVWDSLVADGTAARFPPERHALLGRLSEAMSQARLGGQSETPVRLTGRLLALGHAIPLDPGTRADLLMDLEELRSRISIDTFASRQRLATLAEAGDAPTEADVESFLAASGTVTFCRAQGLPLGDWRDYREPNGSGTPAPR